MTAPQTPTPRKGIFIGLFIAALLIAGGVSYYASSKPDGLEKVATEKGIDARVKPHHIADSPLANYGVAGISNARASVGLAGILGVVIVAGVAGGLFFIIKPRKEPAGQPKTSS